MEQAGEPPPAISSSSSLFESGRRALNLKLLRCGLLFLQGESPSCHPLTRQLNLLAGGRLSFPLRPQNAMITQFDQIKRPAKVHNKHRPPASLSLFHTKYSAHGTNSVPTDQGRPSIRLVVFLRPVPILHFVCLFHCFSPFLKEIKTTFEVNRQTHALGCFHGHLISFIVERRGKISLKT